ncbi:MAG: GNAT family N-acetyltransferase [Tannerella sp.]|nr:GNAT family N-acetyltransferase [Tannerella sp.]
MKLLENDRLRLRAPEPEDLDTLYRWENDSSCWESGNTLTPYSRYAIRQYIARSGNDFHEHRQLRLMIELRRNAAVAGTIDLYDFDPHHLRAGVGILVDQAFRRQGIAAEALALTARYAFSFLKIHHLYAHIPQSNIPCLRLFEQCGFETAGVLKDWMITSEGYANVVVLGMIDSRPARKVMNDER